MGKVAVVTDSVSCLPQGLTEEYAIKIVPINVIVDGEVYRDGCVELYVTDFAPAMGVQAGPGVLALAFYSEEDGNVG